MRAICAVGHARANFTLERLSAREAFAPLGVDGFQVVGVERLLPPLVRHVVSRKTSDLERPLVHREAFALGGVSPDEHRNGVDRSLHFTLGFERFLLGLLSILDVRDCSVPSDEVSGFIASRRRPKQEPTIHPVKAPKARLAVAWLGRGHEPGAKFDKPVFVVGMERLPPAEALSRLKRCAGVFEPLLAEILDIAVGLAAHVYRRDRVQHALHFTFGLERFLLGLLAIFDVGDCPVPGDHVARFISHRGRPKQEPAILAVETPQPRLAVDRISAGYVLVSGFDQWVEVIGMNA